MADPRAKTLARIHRVRTLQLGLVRADEARAQDKLATESALSSRIAQLAAAVAPVPATSAAVALGAAAHFRERLQQSADVAVHRVQMAQGQAARAAEATQAAKRNQSAVEKLMARADADAVLKAIRALEDTPSAKRTRR